jgi:hypothetical protein
VSKVEGSLCLATDGETVLLKRFELKRFDVMAWLIGDVLCSNVFSLLEVRLGLGLDLSFSIRE